MPIFVSPRLCKTCSCELSIGVCSFEKFCYFLWGIRGYLVILVLILSILKKGSMIETVLLLLFLFFRRGPIFLIVFLCFLICLYRVGSRGHAVHANEAVSLTTDTQNVRLTIFAVEKSRHLFKEETTTISDEIQIKFHLSWVCNFGKSNFSLEILELKKADDENASAWPIF